MVSARTHRCSGLLTSPFFAILLLILALTNSASAAPLDIVPQTHSMVLIVGNERRCVFAHTVTANERVHFQYQVRSGSNDFAVSVEHPDGEVVFSAEAGEHTHEDRIFFVTKQIGEYSFCVDNSGRGRDEKVIRLSVAMMSVKKLKKKMDPLLKTMAKAEAALIALNEDQAYLRAREADHRVTIESNNTRILVRWILELVAILGLSFGQIQMLQKLFKKKAERAA